MENNRSQKDPIEAFFEEKVVTPLVHRLAETKEGGFCETRGDELFEAKSYYDALLHYHAAIEINPKESRLFNKRGITFYQLKNYEKALFDYTKAIELKAQPDFFYHRALALKALKRHEEALKDLMKVLEQDPWDMDIMALIIRLRLKETVSVPYF